MKVFKFGGASVKNADAVKNVAAILARYPDQKLLVVVSAMGKTTNKLEELISALYAQDHRIYAGLLDDIKAYHAEILAGLFAEKHYSIYHEIEEVFEQLAQLFFKPLAENRSFQYDQVVSIGEYISSKILAAFINEQGYSAAWLDAKTVIRTDNTYQEGHVDWRKTEELCQQKITALFEQVNIAITQGFIGHTAEGFTTTLGREGSDYTAGILAYCCQAQNVTIWKDVPGMLNADPKYFEQTQLLEAISFKEAIELSYYGASVIHPKTVQPLQQKNIPLYVRSFLDPEAPGTTISENAERDAQVPSFIVKFNQVLVTFSRKDFSFIAEKQLSEIFAALAILKAPINLMQNSALNFSVLVDHQKMDVAQLQQQLGQDFYIRYNENLELATIRHYNEAILAQMQKNKTCLVLQQTRTTARLVLSPII
ncbi:MAG: aspartate kinase [Sphingomonadales bacterium]